MVKKLVNNNNSLEDILKAFNVNEKFIAIEVNKGLFLNHFIVIKSF